MLAWVAVAAVGNLMHPMRSSDNGYVLDGEVMYGSRAIDTRSYVAFGCNTTGTVPQYLVSTSETGTMVGDLVHDYVYLDYQSRLALMTGAVSHTSSVLVVPACDLDEVTVLTNFHNKTLVYFGPPSNGVRARMLEHATVDVDPSSRSDSIGVQLRRGATVRSATLSLAVWQHEINDGTLCGGWTVTDGTTDTVPVVVECTDDEATASGPDPTVLSVRGLGIGVYLDTNASVATFYSTDPQDTDPTTSAFVLVVVFLAMLSWVGFTEGLSTGKVPERRIWIVVARAYLVFNCDAVLMCMSLTMWAALQHKHNMYNLDTIELIGLDRLNQYIFAYSFVGIPVVVLTVLVCFMYGRSTHAEETAKPDHRTTVPWFTWDLEILQHTGFRSRASLFLAIALIFTAFSVSFWILLFSSWPSALVSGLGVLLFFGYLSSSDAINAAVDPIFERMRTGETAYLVYLRHVARPPPPRRPAVPHPLPSARRPAVPPPP